MHTNSDEKVFYMKNHLLEKLFQKGEYSKWRRLSSHALVPTVILILFFWQILMTSSIYVCNVFMANRHVWSAANLKRPTRTQAFKHEMEGACHCFACFVWMVAEALATTSGVKTNTPPQHNLTMSILFSLISFLANIVTLCIFQLNYNLNV